MEGCTDRSGHLAGQLLILSWSFGQLFGNHQRQPGAFEPFGMSFLIGAQYMLVYPITLIYLMRLTYMI